MPAMKTWITVTKPITESFPNLLWHLKNILGQNIDYTSGALSLHQIVWGDVFVKCCKLAFMILFQI